MNDYINLGEICNKIAINRPDYCNTQAILGEERIAAISKINIEYNPKGLADGTSFDVYIEYTPMGTNPNEKGGIGIEVKYTEKEYPIKRGTKCI